jgi:nucleoside-diphosphate-sugar epimerase
VVREANLLDVQPDWLVDIDAVIHLAGCSNNDSATLGRSAAWRDNVTGTERLIQACLETGLARFMHASTCAVYGYQPETVSDEATMPAPVGPYAETKCAAEVALTKAQSATFRPFIFRMATLHGWSPQMRMDLVINSMLKSGMLEGNIWVHHPQTWRPVLHIQDAADAYVRALAAPIQEAGIYNIHFANYRLIDIALRIQASLQLRNWTTQVRVGNRDDVRNYRVDSTKIGRSFQLYPARSVESSIEEMLVRAPARSDWLVLEDMAGAA